MQNVVILARAIGPEDTLKRLLPFLTNIIPETSEEVLVALAKRIAEVVRLSSATQTLDPTAVQLFINCFTELSAFTAPHIHNALSISIEHFLSYYTGIWLQLSHTFYQLWQFPSTRHRESSRLCRSPTSISTLRSPIWLTRAKS